jgi:hypothetical protein
VRRKPCVLFVILFVVVSAVGLATSGSASALGATVLLTDATGVHVYGLAIGPGRVGWADDSASGAPVWSRTYTTSGPLTLGDTTRPGNADTHSGLAVSGIRTAYIGPGDEPTVTDGTTTTTVPHEGFNIGLSGTRLVYQRVANLHWYLNDVTNGHYLDLTLAYGAWPSGLVSLYGDYLSYALSDGSIWRVDVTSNANPVRLSAPVTGQTVNYAATFQWNDWTAWFIVSTDGVNYYETGQFRNVATMDPPVDVADGYTVIGATAAGAELTLGARYAIQPWAGGAITTLPGTQAVLSGARVAWVGTDGLPRLSVLGRPVVDQARSLGNPVTTPGLDTDGTWSVDLPVSAALKTCTVSFSDGTQTVDTVSCDPVAARQGEVMATWTPANALPNGRYTWTVTGTNGAGPLLAADGSTTPISGAVTLSVVVSSVSPKSLPQGATGESVVVRGARFDSGVLVKFGIGVRVQSQTVNSPTLITTVLKVDNTSTLGPRNVVVTLAGSDNAVCSLCFTITA